MALTIPLRRGGRPGQLIEPDRSRPVRRIRSLPDVRGQARGPVDIGIGDDELTHPDFGEGEPDRPAGSARTDLHDRLGVGAVQTGTESGGETRDVGVVPGCAALLIDDDGVDRTDARRDRIDGIEETDDLLLERVGDVEPVEPESDRRSEQFVKRGARKSTFGDVDGAVDRGDGVGGAFVLMHPWGAGGGDAFADEAEEEGCGHSLAFVFRVRSMRISTAWT